MAWCRLAVRADPRTSHLAAEHLELDGARAGSLPRASLSAHRAPTGGDRSQLYVTARARTGKYRVEVTQRGSTLRTALMTHQGRAGGPAIRRFAVAAAVVLIASLLAGGLAAAHTKQNGQNYRITASDCWQMWTKIRHPSAASGYNVDLNVYNGRLPSYCSGAYRSSGPYTLENQGELWGNGGNTFCGDFLLKNSTPVYNFGVGFPSNCTDLTGFGWARALDGGDWYDGSRWVTHE